MQDGPDLPVFTLTHGPWRAEVFDPRPNPSALGARYVHGGYVRALWRNERCLTARASEQWDPYVGEGLPEVFELPLAWGTAREGEEFLRIGAGRMVRRGRDWGSRGELSTTLAWELQSHTPDRLCMRCADRIEQDGSVYGYELLREAWLDDGGLFSKTTLALHVPWSHPVGWFAHPFFAQTRGDATAFELPTGAECSRPLFRDEAGRWRLPPDGGLGNVTNLWGERTPIVVHLDNQLGGGRVEISLNRPLDHAVIYATTKAASPEPQLVRGWKDGETASWTLRDRWI